MAMRRTSIWYFLRKKLDSCFVHNKSGIIIRPLYDDHCYDYNFSCGKPNEKYLRFCRVKSTLQLHSHYVNDDEDNKGLDFPGGRVTITSEMKFISESAAKRVACYRVLDDDGQPIMQSSVEQVTKELAVKMYSDMVRIQAMDTILYEAQRKGRISFYINTMGEEATNIGSAAALTSHDIVLRQYREPGLLLWRGFTLQEFANQCFGNKADYGKGRQMPIH
ncbi:2-oxoisovalerate dehydrogenase subunit alpha [Morus notabilis]|uniref:2-oxoisovalerate dehydrogenase subunit alpha n=1 Tax=Morus notabilis TaxID=981085 RepID=W9QQB7_9ROSA|nr:2-oxoisovalerate dehydrogenase subunit alpha [Morus notabilis]